MPPPIPRSLLTSTLHARRPVPSLPSSTTSISTSASSSYTSSSLLLPRPQQRRWARVQDVRFVTTQRRQDQVLDRYKDKLEEKAKREGHESVSSLKESYKDKIEETRKQASTIGGPSASGTSEAVHHSTASKPSASSFSQPAPPPPTPQAATQQPTGSKQTPAAPGIKPLSSYLDLEKVTSLPNKEVEYIWRLRHANDSKSLCAVIPLETYNRIYQTARSHPQFVLPLPRPAADDGSGDVKQSANGFEGGERSAADIHFLQWGFHPPAGAPPSPHVKTANTHTSTVLFTHLAAFKLHGAYAQPHTTITHHLDLADSHGLVLLNGGVMDDRGVSVEEGRWLLMCLQKFYDHGGHGGGIGKEKRQGLLEQFSNGDERFNLEDLVDEAERIS